MTPEEIYDIILSALDNNEIKNNIIAAAKDRASAELLDGQTALFPVDDKAAADRLRAENSRLNESLAASEAECSALRRRIAELDGQCAKLSMTLSSFAPQLAMYEKYRQLSEQSRKTLDGIFKNSSISGLFLCGVQYDNLCSLRSFTELLVINGTDKGHDTEILSELYAFLLSCYNSTFSEPVYMLTEYKTGDAFDEELHHSLNGKKSGVITKVLLQGCICAKNGKVVRKAFVEAGGTTQESPKGMN